jgi:hypothetical protein
MRSTGRQGGRGGALNDLVGIQIRVPDPEMDDVMPFRQQHRRAIAHLPSVGAGPGNAVQQRRELHGRHGGSFNCQT